MTFRNVPFTYTAWHSGHDRKMGLEPPRSGMAGRARQNHGREVTQRASPMITSSEIISRAAQFECSGNFEHACLLYRQALLQHPGDAELWARLGRNCCALGQPDEALTSFRQAVQLRPEFAEAWLDLGKTLGGLGCQDAAAACCERAARLRPDDPDPL